MYADDGFQIIATSYEPFPILVGCKLLLQGLVSAVHILCASAWKILFCFLDGLMHLVRRKLCLEFKVGQKVGETPYTL